MTLKFEIATVYSMDQKGRIGIAPLPGRGGDLDSDIRAIEVWAPKIVVSMTTVEEMRVYGGDGLPELLKEEGIAWAHMPIVDYGGPQGKSAKIWPELREKLHAILNAGGGVLVHCKGGHGRSGMVALKLLKERGEDADEALERIRAVRPGAVETGEQLAWASADHD